MRGLQNWYGWEHTVWNVTLTRKCDGNSIGDRLPQPIYAAGTRCHAVMDDPERPKMADVELPNGKMVRMWHDEVEVIDVAYRPHAEDTHAEVQS